jgi:hypothetical protein
VTEPHRDIIAAAYDRYIEYALRPNPLADLWKQQHDDWWANQTRWYKARYRARTAVSNKSYSLRQRLADWIYPEGRNCCD